MPPSSPDPSDHLAGDPPTPVPLDVVALLQRCGSEADHEAFAVLYDALASKVYGVAYRVLRNSSLAEEAAQEAFIDLWLQAASFDPARGSARNWILTIVRRRAVDKVRHVSAVQSRDHKHASAHSVQDRDPTADHIVAEIDRALASANAQVLREALDRLPNVQRQAIELAYFGGHTHSEIASLIGIPLGTGKTRIRDGLRRLRAELSDARPPAELPPQERTPTAV